MNSHKYVAKKNKARAADAHVKAKIRKVGNSAKVIPVLSSEPGIYPPTYKYQAGLKKEFYQTQEWRTVRYQAIRSSDCRCVFCGAAKGDKTIDGRKVIIHVDHIKPRSRFPLLELSLENLQITCEDCNLGKADSIQI